MQCCEILDRRPILVEPQSGSKGSLWHISDYLGPRERRQLSGAQQTFPVMDRAGQWETARASAKGSLPDMGSYDEKRQKGGNSCSQ